jgi:hypothetical protein
MCKTGFQFDSLLHACVGKMFISFNTQEREQILVETYNKITDNRRKLKFSAEE